VITPAGRFNFRFYPSVETVLGRTHLHDAVNLRSKVKVKFVYFYST